MQWASAGHLDDIPLLDACVSDQRFDMDVEDTRGAWLWHIIQAVNANARFREPILATLRNLSEGHDASQLCELAFHYAMSGDETFRSQLYEIVKQKPFADRPWLGEVQILNLDAEKGFLFAARVRGAQLANRQWEWDDRSFVDTAIERFGRERVNEILQSSMDVAIKRFRNAWLQHQEASGGGGQTAHAERMRRILVAAVVAAAESDEGSFPYFRGWGMHASAEDLLAVFERLLVTKEPSIVAKYLKVFSNREIPRFDEKLIAWSQHADNEVRRRAFAVLAKNSHPSIRKLALRELGKGTVTGAIVGLFIKNYQHGDEQRILESIVLPDDENELHWLLMDAVKVLESHPDADCSKLGPIVYAITPCSSCRYYAARLLHSRRIAPLWMVEECKYDSVEDIRHLVEH